MSKANRDTRPAFEQSLAELEKIVSRMEQGDQALDRMLKDFEHGMALARECRISLDQAQQRVDRLVKKDGEYVLEPLSPTGEETDAGEETDGAIEDHREA